VLLWVPRLFERVYAAALNSVARHPLRQRLLRTCIDYGWQHFLAQQGRAALPGLLRRATWQVLRALVARQVLDRLGGRVRIAVSGSAALSAEVSRFFLGLGIPVLEGYGLTEAASSVTGNPLDDIQPGTAGKPLPGTEIKLAENYELLVRGPGVMLGYWREQAATQRAIDADGWLHTGDRATWHGDHLVIQGRLKEVLATSTGEKLAPADVETAILADPLFDQALVVGEGRPYVIALLVLDRGEWRQFAHSFGLDAEAPESLADARAKSAVLQRLRASLRAFPRHAVPGAVYLTLERWSVQNGLLSVTLKPKRHAITAHFADAIDRAYAEAAAGNRPRGSTTP
jgi:long-chain acyl-CoA synthetase